MVVFVLHPAIRNPTSRMDHRVRHHLEGPPLFRQNHLVHGALPLLRANHPLFQVRQKRLVSW